MSRFIAVDVGAESGRLIVGTLQNDKLTLEEAYRFPNGGVSLHGRLYWDALRIFSEIKTGLSKISKEFGGDLVSIAVDTWGVDFGLLDANDQLITNPQCYRDSRTDGKLEEALEIVPKDDIFNATAGIQFMSINTLYQLFSIRDSWMLREAQTFLMMPDLLNFWLTGVKACEYTDATTTQFFDSRKRDWARDLLDRLGIPHHFLPPDIILPGNVLAPLAASIAAEVGLEPLPVIAGASHDTAAAIAGVPAEADDFAWMSSGTWSLMGGVADAAITRPEALEYNFSNYGGPGGGVLPWKNIMGLWLVQACRSSWAKQGQEFTYAELAQLAADSKPFTAIIDPDNTMFLAPPDMPAAIQAFCQDTGQTLPQTTGEIVRTVLESLALRYRWVMEKLEELVGHPYSQLHIVGGGSQNQLLNQLTADAMNKPVIAGPVEATAMGNIMIQALATGHVSSMNEARQVIRNSTQVQTFNPNSTPAMDAAYATFEQLLQNEG